MGSLRDRLARWMSSGDLVARSEVEQLVEVKLKEARQALPMALDYDPRNEGYRRYSAEETLKRDLTPMGQDLMIELAYYLYDSSGLVKRFVRDTKNFVLGEGVEFSVENDDESGSALAVLDEFWNDSVNAMNVRLEKRVEFLCLLGEQCWPVVVNPVNGAVRLSYIDPANIDDVAVDSLFPEMAAAVRLKGMGGRSGQVLSVIREGWDPMKREYGRLSGECFFFSINNPPNGMRGRSDLVSSFDFINGFEEGLFDELDRFKLIKSFIWDVSIAGGNEDDIREFLQKNRTPKPGSVRAHNERVTWNAVAPDLKAQDTKALFDFAKTYLAGVQNRPDSWLGSGGKAYQTEAELMGEPTFKDLGSRQRYVKYMLEHVLQFAIDQAIIKGRLKEPKGKPLRAKVSMPEMATKDLKEIVGSLFQLAQALTLAQNQKWVTAETATKLFVNVAERVGIEIDVAEEIRKAASEPTLTEDYAAREGLINDLAARIEARRKGS